LAKRSDFIAMAMLTIIFSYFLAVGATFNGIFDPKMDFISLGMMALVVSVWLLMHWRGGWHWYRTSLDTVFLLWFLAFGVSLVANNDVWRRIDIGLWYMVVYIGVWYVLHDLIANRALRREVIIDVLLIAGFVIVLFGFVQLQLWLRQVISTAQFTSPPRPVSVFGNPNFLSDFLIVLIPLTLSRLMSARARLPRILLGLYTFLQIVLLVLTSSRGAWIGAGLGLLVWILLVIGRNGQGVRNNVATWWQQQSSAIKTGLAIIAVISVLGAVAFSVIFIRSFSDRGREATLRVDIYAAAIELFKEKPITGQGLFTFGRGLVRLPDIHPDKPHSHAHDAPLHVAAELGVLGLVALAATLFVGYRTMQVNWQASTARERLVLAGAIGGVVAFAVHQLTDMPAMMPAIALTGLVALVLALAPKQPELVNETWARTGHPVEMVGIWAVVIITGFWSSGIYTNYVAILYDARDTGNYQQAAESMKAVIASDPQLSLYDMQQGFLYGMAASTGDLEAAKSGIAAYEHFIQLDPGYAVVWVNLAALKWQVGAQDEAITDLQQAIKLDSVEWNYYALLTQYAAAMGKSDMVDAAYKEALTLYPDASLYTEFDTYVQAHPEAVDQTKLTVGAYTVWLIHQGDVDKAEAIWKDTPLNSAPSYVIQALLAMAKHNADGAAEALNQAEKLIIGPVEQAWVHVGKARLAGLIGNSLLVGDEVKAAEEALKTDPLASDDDTLINIAYAQFLQVAIERQYLPQVNYRRDPVLLYLLSKTLMD
jgi:O-antigen ligase/tetratricopeptide (TPR) repeat protein